jgi:hypothetical protein
LRPQKMKFSSSPRFGWLHMSGFWLAKRPDREFDGDG